MLADARRDWLGPLTAQEEHGRKREPRGSRMMMQEEPRQPTMQDGRRNLVTPVRSPPSPSLEDLVRSSSPRFWLAFETPPGSPIAISSSSSTPHSEEAAMWESDDLLLGDDAWADLPAVSIEEMILLPPEPRQPTYLDVVKASQSSLVGEARPDLGEPRARLSREQTHDLARLVGEARPDWLRDGHRGQLNGLCFEGVPVLKLVQADKLRSYCVTEFLPELTGAPLESLKRALDALAASDADGVPRAGNRGVDWKAWLRAFAAAGGGEGVHEAWLRRHLHLACGRVRGMYAMAKRRQKWRSGAE